MAHKKSGGSSRNGRDSDGRRLGVKKFGGSAKDATQPFNPSTNNQQPTTNNLCSPQRLSHNR